MADAADPVELGAGNPGYAISHPLASAVIRLAFLHSPDKLAALGGMLEDNDFTGWPLLDPLLKRPGLTRLQRIEGWLALWRGDRFHRYVLAREGPDYREAYRLADDLCWLLVEAERRGEVIQVPGQAEDALELINGQTLHALRVVFAADQEQVETEPRAPLATRTAPATQTRASPEVADDGGKARPGRRPFGVWADIKKEVFELIRKVGMGKLTVLDNAISALCEKRGKTPAEKHPAPSTIRNHRNAYIAEFKKKHPRSALVCQGQ